MSDILERQGVIVLTREQFDGLRALAEQNSGRVEVAHLKTANSGTIGGRSYVIVDKVEKRKAQRRRPHLNENRKRSEYEGGRRNGSRRHAVRRSVPSMSFFPNMLNRQSIGLVPNAPKLTEYRLRYIAAKTTEGRREGERREGSFCLGRRNDKNGDFTIGHRFKTRRKNERRGLDWSRRKVVRRGEGVGFYTRSKRMGATDRRASS